MLLACLWQVDLCGESIMARIKIELSPPENFEKFCALRAQPNLRKSGSAFTWLL